MAVTEIKKWTVILVFVGLIMSLGGSWAISQERARANTEDITCLEQAVDGLRDNGNTFSSEVAQINSRLSAIETNIDWIKNALEKQNN